jgi:RAB protein geranylgeranyltransferase component A
MKFLRYLQTEEESPTNEEEMQESFPSFLQSKLQIAPELYDPLASLSLTPKPLDSTTASYALSRIKRHLQSLGVFGPGFASMLMKWGGGAELAQIACRACAVGGGVYVLNRGIQTVAFPDEGNIDDGLRIELSNGESVRSSFLVGSAWDLPTGCVEPENQTGYARATRCVMIVSSPLETLFPVTSEGGPVSAGTVVIFPGQAVSKGDDVDSPPVYLVIHSSDTGECPAGQSKSQLSLLFLCFTSILSNDDNHVTEYLSTLSATALMINYL